MNTLISPSMLSCDFTNFIGGLREIEASGADMIHCDIMDGVFVPNITFGQPMIADMRKKTKLLLDVHLMIADPMRYIEEFAAAGADIITVHAEACVHLDRTVNLIKSLGKKAGVALNPSTHCSAVEYVMETTDLVLCMSVNPGFGGQSFIPSTLKKLAEIKKMVRSAGRDILIEVDGGVDKNNAALIREIGRAHV